MAQKKTKDKDVKKAEKPKFSEDTEYLMDYVDLEEHRKKTGEFHPTDPRNIDRGDLGKPFVEETDITTEDRIKFLKDLAKRRNKFLGKKIDVAKGGSMPQQMELFSEGGLRDEGNTVDPVSGNDVPLGATQEEVRDDIPAQLSEGEFVFPADVVRYIGLEKLMMMRQEAKAGLKRMEEMGQMGNADEATLPDDMPFDIADLDMRDETEEDVLQANVGAFVPPNRFPTGQSYQPYVNPYMPTGNVTTPYAPYQPGQSQEILAPAGGGTGQVETEMRRYVKTNPSGGVQVRMIPFNKATGTSLYPIDDLIKQGFVRQDEAPKVATKQKTAKVQTTKVRQEEEGGEDDPDKLSTLGGARMDVGGREFAVGYNFDGSITLTDPKTMESKNYKKDTQIAKDVKSVAIGHLVEVAKLTPGGIQAAVIKAGFDKIGVTLPGSTKISNIIKNRKLAKDRLDKTPSGIGVDPTTGMTLDDMKSIQAGLTGEVTGDTSAGVGKDGQQLTMQDLADAVSDDTGKIDLGGGDTITRDDQKASNIGSTVGASVGQFGGIGDFKQGGLAKKKKPKVKRMKKGGLASKK